MKNLPNFKVEINGSPGEIYVSDNEDGRYMCVFVKTNTTDFAHIYKAYGFMVWTPSEYRTMELFPIKLQEDTKLTFEVMSEMWKQIHTQIESIPELKKY